MKIRIWFILSAAILTAALPAFPQTQTKLKCPEEMASLMPEDAANQTGQYSSAGNTSMGIAGAELPFDFQCPPTSKYPAKLKMTLKKCHGNAPEACRTQLLSLEAETIRKDRISMTRSRDNVRLAVGVTPLTEEQFAGGTALYFVSTARCWAAGMGSAPSEYPYMPTIEFKWYAHTASSSITVTITGNMTAEKAKAMVEGIAVKFRKAMSEK